MQGKCSVGATSPWPAKVGPRSPLVRTKRSPRPGCSATAGEPEGRPGLCTVHIVGPLYAWTMSFTALHRALGVGPGPLTDELLDAAVAAGVVETSDLDWKPELPPAKGLPQTDFPRMSPRWRTAAVA